MKLPAYLLVIVLLLGGTLLFSQTCDSMLVCDCAAKDLSPAGIMLGHEHPKGVWKVSYRYMGMRMDGNLSGTKKVDDNYIFNNYIMSPKNMRMDMHMVMAMYGISNRLSVMAMFNYNVSSMNMNMLPGTMNMTMNGSTMVMSTSNSNSMNSTTSGFGDTKIYAVYSFINRNVHHLLLSGGINIPTGSIQKKGKADDMMYPSSRYPYMMQMGSGTYDFMPGLTYLLKANKVSFSAQITTLLRPFLNSLHFGYGNEYTLNIWGAYKWLPWISTSLRLEGLSVATMSGKDATLYAGMEPSANSMNYGGHYVNSYFGFNFYLNRGWLKNNRLSVEYGMPLYQNINGIQMQQKSTIYAGWLISF
jgi:hypothetical protein